MAKRLMLAAVAASALLLAACGGSLSSASSSTDANKPTPTPAVHSGLSAALCLACHSQTGITIASSQGQERFLEVVYPNKYYASAHGQMSCVECHGDQSTLPHATFTDTGQPIAQSRDSTAVCSSCHRAAYEHFLDSVHGTVVKLGDSRAPGCTDCHTTHYVQPVKTWTNVAKAQACSRCHKGADAAFASGMTHREPSPSRLAINYFAGRFFGALVVMVLGIGIVYVELDLLRWLKRRIRRRQ